MRIAVTGGRGRLGRYVVRELARHHTVRAIDRGPPDRDDDLAAVDVLDGDALAKALAGQEIVAHLAAIDRSVARSPEEVFETNVRGTWNVFHAAARAGVRRIILCSSSSALGLDDTNPEMPPLYLPIDESHPARPTATYGLSKVIGEQIAAAFARTGEIEVLVLRPVYVAFPEMIPFLLGKPGREPGREAEPRPYLRAYVGPEDAARAFLLAAERAYAGIETFHIAAADTFIDEPTLDHIRGLYGAVPPLHKPEIYGAQPRASAWDIEHARRALGWRPSTSWADLRRRIV
ncbi:MAG TPA: NAD(P)-dependent oxidoreductase [Stellaceae bacterium]|nr:NAD(P)-dependent oxidoreductase [Stellaceae bacterium]